MNKKKIFNDPVYGFVTIPYEIIFDLIEHPYFQRLRRIKQLGLTHYVYPGALHTRFHHAIGAMHLMTQAIKVLRSKNIEITDEEAEAACIAILLHDIGHCPFSHALEHIIVDIHHEDISIKFMELLNEEFDGKLSLAIQIFKNEYSKKFLYQLISGQLDMDRMDYLNRDSFFSGVSEGVIGYDRIIKMLNVVEDELVVEEKGIYSIEKFLLARRIMYWQVYLHKTVLSAEQMLISCIKRAKYLAQQGVDLKLCSELGYFLAHSDTKKAFEADPKTEMAKYAKLDDVDVLSALKIFTTNDDFLLSFQSKSLLDRRLFRVELKGNPFKEPYVKHIEEQVLSAFNFNIIDSEYLILRGKESNNAYNTQAKEIKILFKNGETLAMSEISELGINSQIITKYYLCYPKILL